MANYKDLHGFEIKHRSSDPPSPIEGEIWYNTTSKTLKLAPKISAWSAGGALSTSRSQLAGAGIQTAGLVFGGSATNTTAPSGTHGAKTEEYDGSSWTAGGNKSNLKRQLSGFGLQTAAVEFGGYSDEGSPSYRQVSEEYDGSSWTAGGNYISVISNGCGGGTGSLTAGFNYGGYTPDTYVNTSAEYDGSSWTSGNTAPYTAGKTSMTGTQTAVIGIGGNAPPTVTTAVEYDGTNFTVATSVPVVFKLLVQVEHKQHHIFLVVLWLLLTEQVLMNMMELIGQLVLLLAQEDISLVIQVHQQCLMVFLLEEM